MQQMKRGWCISKAIDNEQGGGKTLKSGIGEILKNLIVQEKKNDDTY